MRLGTCALTAVFLLGSGCLGSGCALAQQIPPPPPNPNPAPEAPPGVPLEWTPAPLAELNRGAEAKSSFTLDRNTLSAAAGLMGDSDADAKAAVRKLDGVSVHLLRFASATPPDPALVESLRQAYHLPGWKHVVDNGRGVVHDGRADVWVMMEGENLRGAVVLVASPNSLTLATVSGNLSPIDLLHLRGHFGIPKFDADGLTGDKNR